MWMWKIAGMMKDLNPKLKVAFVGPPVHDRAGKEPAGLRARSTLSSKKEFRLRDSRLRFRETARRDSERGFFRKNGSFQHNPDAPRD